MFLNADDFNKLCELLDYKFENALLLQQALTRKSGLLEGAQEFKIGHNERLEFFGDSILRTVIDDALMELGPDEGEDQLSKKRDALVSKHGFLFLAAQKIELAQFIIMGKGEQQSCQGAGKKKILADVMEAIIGAVFIDCGKNYQIIKKFILKHSNLDKSLQDFYSQKFIVAVKNNDSKNVNYYLKMGVNPNHWKEEKCYISCPCELSSTPIYIEVAINGLMQNPIDYLIRNIEHDFTRDTLTILEALFAAGIKINYQGAFRYPLLHETIVYYPKRRGDFGLYSTELCKLLCQYGADPNERGQGILYGSLKLKEGYNALELAIIFNEVEKVEILLKFNANPNLKNLEGRTPLHLAAQFCDFYLAREESYKQSPSFFKEPRPDCLAQFKDIINLLLRFNANKSLPDNNGKIAADLTKNEALKKFLTPMQQSEEQSEVKYASAAKVTPRAQK